MLGTGKHSFLLWLFSIFLLLSSIQTANAYSYPEANWITDSSSGCQVWALGYTLKQSDKVKWSGDCLNGKAHGKGVAIFFSDDGDEVGTYRGLFQAGSFVGETALEVDFKPLAYGQFMVTLGKADTIPATVLLIQSAHRLDGSFQLCNRVGGELYVVVERGFSIEDSEITRNAMIEAINIYNGHCDIMANLKVAVIPSEFNEVSTPKKQTQLLPKLATARYTDVGKGKSISLSDYLNESARIVDEKVTSEFFSEANKKRKAKLLEKRKSAKKRYTEFSKKYDIEGWVTTKILHENPFRWKNKVVGLFIRLDRMIDEDLARVYGIEDFKRIMIKSFPSDLASSSNERVAVAVRITKPGDYELPEHLSDHYAGYTASHFIGGEICEELRCEDFWRWADENGVNFEWGVPESQDLP